MAAVTRYQLPAYPTRTGVQAQPDLLALHVPPAWLANGTAGALSFLLAAGTGGCGALGGYTPRPASERRPPVGAVVAPIFEHGEGRGATGCVVISPPSFLSEDEAAQVITEEMRRGGLKRLSRRVTWPDVRMPAGVCGPAAYIGCGSPLTVDVVDSEHRVAISYLSEHNHEQLFGPSDSTVTGYNLPNAARKVTEEVRAHHREGVYFGVVYDPMTGVPSERLQGRQGYRVWQGENEWLREKDESARQLRRAQAEARRLLRLQVRDFVDWLRAQGAI